MDTASGTVELGINTVQAWHGRKRRKKSFEQTLENQTNNKAYQRHHRGRAADRKDGCAVRSVGGRRTGGCCCRAVELNSFCLEGIEAVRLDSVHGENHAHSAVTGLATVRPYGLSVVDLDGKGGELGGVG